MKPKPNIRFLSDVWGAVRGWVSVPVKSEGAWREMHPFRWPQDKAKMTTWLREQEAAGADCYFCPTPLSRPRRRAANVTPPLYLWADLDEVNPREIQPRPSIAWESSPGRYQALWKLKRRVSPQDAARLSRKLAYHTGADPGGWDLTQVLRIPGTRNHKYDQPFRVKVLWTDGASYRSRRFESLPEPPETSQKIPRLGDISSEEILRAYRSKLKGRVLQLLKDAPEKRVDKVDRSARLWELECRLAEVGLEPQEIMIVAQASAWNKFAGRRDELKRLWIEAQKAHTTVHAEAPPTRIDKAGFSAPKLLDYATFMAMPLDRPRWLVEDFWGMSSHGILAGEPKSFKSIVATEFLICVASGKPLFGQFKVTRPGPTIMVQVENSPWLVQDRVRKIASARDLLSARVSWRGSRMKITFPPVLPIHFLNNYGFDFTEEEDRHFIEDRVAEIQPRLVIFDPLYLMLGTADENSSRELRPILQWLHQLRVRYNCAVMLVHHWSKHGQSPRGGQRMLGSTTLHAWTDSALYVGMRDEEKHTVELERESRSYPKRAPLELTFSMDDPGGLKYEIAIGEARGEMGAILDLILSSPGGILMTDLTREADKTRRQLQRVLASLEATGKIYVEKGGGRGKPAMVFATAADEGGNEGDERHG